MYINDDDNVNFVSARPVYFEENLPAINIPKKNMFSQLDYAVVLKNKYDGVEASKVFAKDVVDYSTVLTQFDINITRDDIDYVVRNLQEIVEQLRKSSPIKSRKKEK
jgi:hypothetical protein